MKSKCLVSVDFIENLLFNYWVLMEFEFLKIIEMFRLFCD